VSFKKYNITIQTLSSLNSVERNNLSRISLLIKFPLLSTAVTFRISCFLWTHRACTH